MSWTCLSAKDLQCNAVKETKAFHIDGNRNDNDVRKSLKFQSVKWNLNNSQFLLSVAQVNFTSQSFTNHTCTFVRSFVKIVIVRKSPALAQTFMRQIPTLSVGELSHRKAKIRNVMIRWNPPWLSLRALLLLNFDGFYDPISHGFNLVSWMTFTTVKVPFGLKKDWQSVQTNPSFIAAILTTLSKFRFYWVENFKFVSGIYLYNDLSFERLHRRIWRRKDKRLARPQKKRKIVLFKYLFFYTFTHDSLVNSCSVDAIRDSRVKQNKWG